MSGIANVPVQGLRGVGPRLASKLADYGVRYVEDLLFHLPLRYQDRTRLTPIAAAQEGADVVIEGEVRAADIVFGRRRSLVARIQDGSGTLTLRFFHFSAAQKHNLQSGTRLIGIGMWLGLFMAANVWFVIWPNQQRALGLVQTDDATKAKSARMAMLGSRTNFVLSVPMLYCMVAQQNGAW